MDKKRIKIGVLGCSSIAVKQVLPAIVESDELELTWIASRDISKASLEAAKYNCNACKYDDLFTKSDVDAIYVSLPPALHFEYGLKVIQSGKHLLMEKPFTTDYADAVKIFDLADKSKLIAMEVLMYVYHPIYQEIKKQLNGDTIGQLKHIEAIFGFPAFAAEDIRNKPEIGGGAILDALIYPLSFCIYIAGKMPTECFEYIENDPVYHVDKRGTLLLDFGKVSATVNYGFGLMYRNTCTLWGDKGYIVADRVFSPPSDFNGSVKIVQQQNKREITLDAQNKFLNLLNDFSFKIKGVSNTGMNERNDILPRLKIITDLLMKTKNK